VQGSTFSLCSKGRKRPPNPIFSLRQCRVVEFRQ